MEQENRSRRKCAPWRHSSIDDILLNDFAAKQIGKSTYDQMMPPLQQTPVNTNTTRLATPTVTADHRNNCITQSRLFETADN